jgi:RimJ/RimL family protein N-acetyltransferase
LQLETKRLLLRPWNETDAEDLYAAAKNPKVGPSAGWPVHTSIEDSRETIRTVLSAEGTYAIFLKNTGRAIGSIGLKMGDRSDLMLNEDEAEIGYWLAEPFWGEGLMPEAMQLIIKYAFTVFHKTSLWCGYFAENSQSKRVQEKCGFRYHHTEYEKPFVLIGKKKTEHFTRLTKKEWEALPQD